MDAAPARLLRLVLLAVVCGLTPAAAGSGSAFAADSLTENVPLPGGIAGMARALGLEPGIDRARAVAEFTRLIYGAAEGVNNTTDARLRTLAAYLDTVGAFQASLDALDAGTRGISLANAGDKSGRKRLESLLELIGLRLREKNRKFLVERRSEKEALERVRLLTNIGVDLGDVASRLTKGETIKLQVPSDIVPLPLSRAVWQDVVFKRQTPNLISSILADRRAALLAHGLASLDDDTLLFLSKDPKLLSWIYDERAAGFAVFGSSVHVRDGRVLIPGGATAETIWESVLGETVQHPEAFIRQLLSRNSGQVAYLYDLIANLDPSRRAFALGAAIPDQNERLDRFKRLIDVGLAAADTWVVERRPFERPPYDAVAVLSSIRVGQDGKPGSPRGQRFWQRAFDGVDLPDDPARDLREADTDIDAAWIVDRVLSATSTPEREVRLAQFEFGQRAFASADARTLPDVLVAVRAIPRFRELMLTLERMGLRNPATYSACARSARAVGALDKERRFSALRQFQGALAVVDRLARSNAIRENQAETLVSAVAALPLHDGHYLGGVSAWMRDVLAPALGPEGALRESTLIDMMAGSTSHAPVQRVAWEGESYRVDLPRAESTRMRQIRERQGQPTIDTVLDVDRIARALQSEAALDEVRKATAALTKLAASLASPKAVAGELPPGLDSFFDAGDALKDIVKDLSGIKQPRDVNRASKEARRVLEVADWLTGQALVSIVYAFELGDPKAANLSGQNVANRHDFGLGESDGELQQRVPWMEPAEDIYPGRPWRVRGSVLGLDAGLAHLALRRTDSAPVPEPLLNRNERSTFVRSLAIMEPLHLQDATQAAAAAAEQRGRARVAGLTQSPEGLDTVADESGMDGWRRSAVRWALINDARAVPSYFSMVELLRLGGIETAELRGWGMADSMCLCLEMRPRLEWWAAIGREARGVLSTQITDLNLHVATALQELGLPPALTKAVLARAVQDFVDRVRPTDDNDWLTLIRAAQAIPRQKIEDYVASLTIDGPLFPDTPPAK